MKQLLLLLSATIVAAASYAQPGSIDLSFNPGTGANDVVLTTALQPDGTSINHIAQVNADGTTDTTFNSGKGADNNVLTTVVQPDGKIIIGGHFTSYNGKSKNRIARLNADGSLDTTFHSRDGADSYVRTTVLQPDGKIIIGRNFWSYNGAGKRGITRLNADGTIDVAEQRNIGYV